MKQAKNVANLVHGALRLAMQAVTPLAERHVPSEMDPPAKVPDWGSFTVIPSHIVRLPDW